MSAQNHLTSAINNARAAQSYAGSDDATRFLATAIQDLAEAIRDLEAGRAGQAS